MPASNLATYRRKKGLTQEQLAELSGVTARTIQRIENGAVVPHIQTLKMLADCLGINTELLMDDAEGNAPASVTQSTSTNLIPLFHLLALLGLFLPILNIILPLALWIFKKDENPDYDRQGKQVLNFQITMSALFFPAIVLMVLYFPVGFPLMFSIYIFAIVMTLINLFRSVKPAPVNYPLSYRFFKVQGTI